MKRYEKMSKEEIIDLWTKFDCGDCDNCPVFDKDELVCTDKTDDSCSDVIKNWLYEGVEK